MRAIDADAIKEDLTRFYDNEVTARKLIDEQPTIQPEPHWIPVTERLPENNDHVNVTWVNHRYWYSSVTQDYLDEYGEWTPDHVDKDVEIIAWMPLPEPYKGVTE